MTPTPYPHPLRPLAQPGHSLRPLALRCLALRHHPLRHLALRCLAALCCLAALTGCADDLFPGGDNPYTDREANPDGMAFGITATEQADRLMALGRTRAAQGQTAPLLDSTTRAALTGGVAPFAGQVPATPQLYLHRHALPLVGIHPHTVAPGQRAGGIAASTTPSAPGQRAGGIATTAPSLTRAPESAVIAAGSNPLNFHDSLTIWGSVYDLNDDGTINHYRNLFHQVLLKKIRGWRSSVHWPYTNDHESAHTPPYSDTRVDTWQGQKMNFCALAPAYECLEDLKVKEPEEIVAADGKHLLLPSFTYTVPQEPALQRDLLFAISDDIDVQAGPSALSQPEQYPAAETPKDQHLGQDDKTIPLTFRHILTAVRFAQGQMPAGVTITGIELHNIYGTGTYTPGTGWSDQTGQTDYQLTAGQKTAGDNVYIDGGQVLFLMPQSFDNTGTVDGAAIDATLRITLHKDGEDKETTHTLEASLYGTNWTEGYTITYEVSISELFDDYYLFLDPTPSTYEATYTHQHSETSGSFTLHSYKNLKDITLNGGTGGEVHYAAPWRVKGFSPDGTTKDAEGNVIYNAENHPVWLDRIDGWDNATDDKGAVIETPTTPSGTGDAITVAYTLKKQSPVYSTNHQTVLANNSHARVTKANGDKENTEESAYAIDLSTHIPDQTNATGWKERSETQKNAKDEDEPVPYYANCYIVNSSGPYKFPTIYGNGENYSGYKDHEGDPITSPNITTHLQKYGSWVDAGSEELAALKKYDMGNSDGSGSTITSVSKREGNVYAYNIKQIDIPGNVDNSVSGNIKAELVWSDNASVFKNIQYSSSYINFAVDMTNIAPANAIIALMGKKAKRIDYSFTGTATQELLQKATNNIYRSEWYDKYGTPLVITTEDVEKEIDGKKVVEKVIKSNSFDSAPWDTLWTWHIWVTDEVFPNNRTATVVHRARNDYSQTGDGDSQSPDYAYPSYNPTAGTKLIKVADGSYMLPVNLGWVPKEMDFGKYEPREVWVEIEQLKGDGKALTGKTVHFQIRQEAEQDKVEGTSPLFQWGRPTPLPMPATRKIQVVNSLTSGDGLYNPIARPQAIVAAWPDGSSLWGSGTEASKTIYDPSPLGFYMPEVALYSAIPAHVDDSDPTYYLPATGRLQATGRTAPISDNTADAFFWGSDGRWAQFVAPQWVVSATPGATATPTATGATTNSDAYAVRPVTSSSSTILK